MVDDIAALEGKGTAKVIRKHPWANISAVLNFALISLVNVEVFIWWC